MSKKFEPKEHVELAPPKDDIISVAELNMANGTGEDKKCYVAIKGIVYDVTGKTSYQPNGSYHVFAGKDASRALALSSTKPEDVRPEWKDLEGTAQDTLNDWVTYFSKRYNVVGTVEGATNME